jgi:hypothetical protein
MGCGVQQVYDELYCWGTCCIEHVLLTLVRGHGTDNAHSTV